MQWGQEDIARHLVGLGAQVSVHDISGWTPVILAANGDDVAMMELLLEQGGTLEGHRNGWGPLNYAAHHGRVKMVRYLLDMGVNPNRVWTPQRTRMDLPIHSAAFMGHLKIVKLLLKAGAVADAPDGDGNRARDFARQQKEQKDKMQAMTSDLGPGILGNILNKLDIGQAKAGIEPELGNPFDKPWEDIIAVLEKSP